jgi:lipoprotein-anchoring transpeptidase ErfK/SrfK
MRFWIALCAGLTVMAAMGSGSPTRAAPETVPFTFDYPTGAIVIANRERRLYLVTGDGQALRYPVAIGVPDEQWMGLEVITAKRENPRWIEPDDDGEGQVIEGGDPRNPLGKRALYLGSTLWRIHGTVAPWSIGKAASNGCIRMHNADVIDLYERVELGSIVYVVDVPGQTPRPERRGRKLVDD